MLVSPFIIILLLSLDTSYWHMFSFESTRYLCTFKTAISWIMFGIISFQFSFLVLTLLWSLRQYNIISIIFNSHINLWRIAKKYRSVNKFLHVAVGSKFAVSQALVMITGCLKHFFSEMLAYVNLLN